MSLVPIHALPLFTCGNLDRLHRSFIPWLPHYKRAELMSEVSHGVVGTKRDNECKAVFRVVLGTWLVRYKS